MNDDFDGIPAFVFVHGIADDSPNALSNALNKGNAALFRFHEYRPNDPVGLDRPCRVRNDNAYQIRCCRVDGSCQAGVNCEDVADVVFLDLALDAARPHPVFSNHVVHNSRVTAGVEPRLKMLFAPLVFEAQMIIRIFLVGNDVAGWLRAAGRSIFVHVNRSVLDVDEVIGIVTSGITQNDVPAIEVRAVEERGPARVTGRFPSESKPSAQTRHHCEAEKNTADNHIRALAEII